MFVASASRAEFLEPIRISHGGRGVEAHALGVDDFGIAHVAYVEAGAIFLRSRGPGIDVEIPIATQARDPSLVFFPVGQMLAYAQEHALEPGAHVIQTRSRVGLVLTDPVPQSDADADARRPVVRLSSRREPIVVWEAPGPDDSEIFLRLPGGESRSLGRGSHPSLEVERTGRMRIIFLRDGTLHHVVANTRQVTPAQPILEDLDGIVSPPRTGMLDGRVLVVAFSSRGTLYRADDASGEFVALEVDSGVSGGPSLHVAPSGMISMAYVSRGDIRAVIGNEFATPSPLPVTSTLVAESSPAIAVDFASNIYVTFQRGTDVYLTTDAGPAQADFDFAPSRGPVPLDVRFTDTSSGSVSAWRWDFGDGGTSTLRNPVHTYQSAGAFRVRLTVFGPAGESALVHEEQVLVSAPGNRMWIGDIRVFPGQRAVNVPVLLDHDAPAQGFQIAARHDPTLLEVLRVDFAASNSGPYSPELGVYTVWNEPDEPYVTAGVLFDVAPPFDLRKLPPGDFQRIANIVVDVKREALGGTTTEIELVDDVGRPPIRNVLIVDTRTVVPVLGPPGRVEIAEVSFPPPRFFIRGDVDGSGQVNIADAVAVLNYLFSSAVEPRCLDAADATDSGLVDISDAAFILNFLFRSGSYFPVPYPEFGLDPTPDDLPFCPL